MYYVIIGKNCDIYVTILVDLQDFKCLCFKCFNVLGCSRQHIDWTWTVLYRSRPHWTVPYRAVLCP